MWILTYTSISTVAVIISVNEDNLNILSDEGQSQRGGQSPGQSDSNFPILNLNDRSLRDKVDDLKLLLANLNLKFTVIGISETSLQNDSHDVDMLDWL